MIIGDIVRMKDTNNLYLVQYSSKWIHRLVRISDNKICTFSSDMVFFRENNDNNTLIKVLHDIEIEKIRLKSKAWLLLNRRLTGE